MTKRAAKCLFFFSFLLFLKTLQLDSSVSHLKMIRQEHCLFDLLDPILAVSLHSRYSAVTSYDFII